MRKTVKCTYRIELSFIDFNAKCKRWQSIGLMAKDIRPTEKDVKRYRDAMNESIMTGSNKHLASSQSLFSNAVLIDQRINKIVATYTAPMFEAL